MDLLLKRFRVAKDKVKDSSIKKRKRIINMIKIEKLGRTPNNLCIISNKLIYTIYEPYIIHISSTTPIAIPMNSHRTYRQNLNWDLIRFYLLIFKSFQNSKYSSLFFFYLFSLSLVSNFHKNNPTIHVWEIKSRWKSYLCFLFFFFILT